MHQRKNHLSYKNKTLLLYQLHHQSFPKRKKRKKEKKCMIALADKHKRTKEPETFKHGMDRERANRILSGMETSAVVVVVKGEKGEVVKDMTEEMTEAEKEVTISSINSRSDLEVQLAH